MNKIVDYNQLKLRLENAQSIVFFTGAGISAESGIATFRGNDGLWNKFKPEELASFDAFIKNPDLVWAWYQYRRKILSEARPNNAHKAIVEFEKKYDVTTVTQNVDNLHHRAGSKVVYELHGNIERNYCIDCGKFFEINDLDSQKVFKCDSCEGLIRPDVVWFGEMLPEEQFNKSELSASRCDICFVVGTSSLVYPAANIPLIAKRNGAFIVEINLEKTSLSYNADMTILGKAGEILTDILELV